MATRLEQLDPASLEIRLTPMRRRHLRGVLRIEAQVYPRPWSLGLFVGELALRGSRIYLVARWDQRVVGYAGLMLIGGDGHITTIAVEPALHGNKIGTRLLLHLARQGVARGAEHLTLEVRVNNEPAQAMYRAFGFGPAGIRKNYYAEIGEDALVMWARDVQEPAYTERLDRLAGAIPGSTIVEDGQ
ncbi:ribosomal protein S18-alanine N-acetyltransferase [soil metagenome]